jgi:hypothetical protein
MSTTSKILSRILELPTKFFVDIGAANDPNESQSELLLRNGWSGIMFECNPEKFVPLTERMREFPVKVISEKVTPDNIIPLLQGADVPNDFYLSLDIDGYDFYVLSKILAFYRPQLIISEINEKIPPPIKFTVNYDPSYWWDSSHFYGYSLSMLEDIRGYKVESVDFNNVILSPGVQEIPLADLYRDGYWNMGTRPAYNADFDPIYTMTRDDQIKFIHEKFKKFAGKYTLNGVVISQRPKFFWNKSR